MSDESQVKQMAFDEMLEEQAEQASETASKAEIMVFDKPLTLTAEDIVIPRLRLAQGLTKEVQEGTAKPGQYLLTGAAPVEYVEARVLAVAKFRRLTSKDDGSVLCRSEDAQTGIGDPGGNCEDCPLSKWTNAEKGGKNQPPPCNFGYKYLLDVEGYGQCVFEMKGTALSAAKALNGMVVRFGLNTLVRLQSQKSSGNRGAYYSPVVVPVS